MVFTDKLIIEGKVSEFMGVDRSENPEIMADFFNKRAETYDEHQKENIESFNQFYDSISSCVTRTKSRVRILDIGCGTGLELEGIFERVPNADITAVDVSIELLNRLVDRFKAHTYQITPIQESYLKFHFNKKCYDYVIAVMTLHHLLPNTKMELYQRISNSLKSGGIFIEGDYVVSKEEEQDFLSTYNEIRKNNNSVTDGSHHIDIPLSLETQKRLLLDAGFSKVDVILKQSRSTVYAARP